MLLAWMGLFLPFAWQDLGRNFWVLLSFYLPLLKRPDDGLLKHISSQVQSSKTLFWPDLRDFHLAVETPQLPSRGWAIGYGYFLA